MNHAVGPGSFRKKLERPWCLEIGLGWSPLPVFKADRTLWVQTVVFQHSLMKWIGLHRSYINLISRDERHESYVIVRMEIFWSNSRSLAYAICLVVPEQWMGRCEKSASNHFVTECDVTCKKDICGIYWERSVEPQYTSTTRQTMQKTSRTARKGCWSVSQIVPGKCSVYRSTADKLVFCPISPPVLKQLLVPRWEFVTWLQAGFLRGITVL